MVDEREAMEEAYRAEKLRLLAPLWVNGTAGCENCGRLEECVELDTVVGTICEDWIEA